MGNWCAPHTTFLPWHFSKKISHPGLRGGLGEVTKVQFLRLPAEPELKHANWLLVGCLRFPCLVDFELVKTKKDIPPGKLT